MNLIETFSEFKELKNIDKVTLMGIMEDVFRSSLKKVFGSDENFDIIVNIDKGDFEIWRNRTVVADDELKDSNSEITISEVRAKGEDFEDYEVGEDFTDEVKFEDFGRRAILAVRQNLTSRILQLEKDSIYEKYKEKIGHIVTGDVYQTWKRETLVLDDEENELIMPRYEQIPTDRFRKGDVIRAVVVKVEMRNNTPQIIISRTSPLFLERLFELEVPEIYDGLIVIKKIVRKPGERAKVAVESYDERIDPVGACVGMKGARIHGIVRELRNENIDVINYTENTQLFIQRALSPAQISSIRIIEDEKRADVYLKPEEVSKAIGKNGLNIKLAIQLTGYNIDVFREMEEGEEDVDIDQFTDEIEDWIIDELKAIGCDTAKSVLELSVAELEKRTDLEVETIEEVLSILREEFEE